MDTIQLNNALQRLFIEEEARVVFWHDPAGDFLEFVDGFPLLAFGDTQVHWIRLDQTGSLEVKLLMELEEPDCKFLIYSATEEPEWEDDWLLDVRLYSRSFRADRASILLDELGLPNMQLRDHLLGRRKFFDNKQRLAKLKTWIQAEDSEQDLDRKMMAVICRSSQAHYFDIVQCLFQSWTEGDPADDMQLSEPPAVWVQLVKFELETSFWDLAERHFGFRQETPSLRNLLIHLLVTDLAHGLREALPSAYEHLVLPPSGRHNAVICLTQWRDSASKGGSYDLISEWVGQELQVEEPLMNVSMERLMECDTFSVIEKLLLRLVRDRVLETSETPNPAEIRALAGKRQDGHWARLTHREDHPLFPRQTYRAAYEAMVIASEYQALRMELGDSLSSDNAKALYTHYTDSLYRCDQRYRRFCESCDVAEKKGWDLLKKLRDWVEQDYSQGFLKDLSVCWGRFVDPEGATALMNAWHLEGIDNQYDFFKKHVQPRLNLGENRKVFVIISDALRYEVAEELMRELNGKYRYEAQLSSMLGVLPSYTSLGMASLLPHQELAFNDKADVLVDSRPTGSTQQRQAILEKVGGMVCKADELLEMKKTEARDHVEGARVIYIYHNTIDHVGESKEGQTFAAVRQAIGELSDLVRHLINNFNANHLLVTADHGFLFTESAPEETEKSPIKHAPEGAIKTKQRYVLGRQLGKQGAAWHGSTGITAGTKDGMEFWVPKGINRFHFMGSRQFIHGGAMLQEVAVPLITIKHRKGDKARSATQVKQVSVQVLGTNHMITTSMHRFQLLQMEAVSERVKPITLKVAVYDGENAVTPIETVTFDSRSSSMDDRKKWISLVLKDQEYDGQKPYRLVLREAETSIEKSSIDIKIKRAFSDDF